MRNSGGVGKGTKYQVVVTKKARSEIKRLGKETATRMCKKMKWLGQNADIIVHHYMTSLPDDLKGLCRARSGDWRILYWAYHDEKKIVIYGIGHRSDVYKEFKGGK